MGIKTALLIGAISTTSMIATSANAVDFSTTFTGDNTVLSFSYGENGGTTNLYDLSTLSSTGLTNWGNSSSLSVLGLAANTDYDFIWEVSNISGPSGFLADFTVGSTQYLSSTDSIWSYSSDGTTWSSVTSYGTNTATDPNVWYSIAGIDTNAEWIWDSSNNTTGESLLFKASIITSPVPEPSTYALMLGGLGLVGFMAARRRKTSKLC